MISSAIYLWRNLGLALYRFSLTEWIPPGVYQRQTRVTSCASFDACVSISSFSSIYRGADACTIYFFRVS
jgi:hypothetical protein